jgi:hypothetical protein
VQARNSDRRSEWSRKTQELTSIRRGPFSTKTLMRRSLCGGAGCERDTLRVDRRLSLSRQTHAGRQIVVNQRRGRGLEYTAPTSPSPRPACVRCHTGRLSFNSCGLRLRSSRAPEKEPVRPLLTRLSLSQLNKGKTVRAGVISSSRREGKRCGPP